MPLPFFRHGSSSIEMEEETASNNYTCSTEEFDDDEDDYEMDVEIDSFSYSTQMPADYVIPKDSTPVVEIPDEKTDSIVKTPEEIHDKPPEPEMITPKIKRIRWFSATRAVLLNLLKPVVIFAICIRFAGLMNKNNGRQIITPKFTLESVSVFPIQIEPVWNSTAHNVTAHWNIIVNVKNPSGNHVLSYSDMAAEVYFGKNPLNRVWPLLPGLNKFIPPWITAKSLWGTSIPGFHQTEAHQDLVKVTFASFPVTIDNSLANSLMKDMNSGMSSGFSVRMHANITQKNIEEDFNSDSTSLLTAMCQLDMAFLQSGGGVMASSSEDCKVFTNALESWMVFGVTLVLVHAILRACLHLSNKYLARWTRIQC